MKIEFPYEGVEPVEVPDGQLMGVYAPQTVEHDVTEEELIVGALRNPIGQPRLSELVSANGKTVIVVDDLTRQTPQATILPYVLEELELGGACPENILILIGLGTHRDMSDEEMEQRLGSDVFRRYQVVNHRFDRADGELTFVKKTSAGADVWVNRAVVEADLVISIGHIVPHPNAGMSGGGKMILPGVCGYETVAHMHLLSSRFDNTKITGVTENPVRAEIDEVAAATGLRFIVNVVQDHSDGLLRVFAGDLIEAHRAGCRFSREVYGASMPGRADIVLADSYPCDIDLWQAAKAICATACAARPGGAVILVTPCPEGVSEMHPLWLETGFKDSAKIEEAISNGEVDDVIAASSAIIVAKIIEKGVDLVLVSPGISREETAALGCTYAATPAEAFEMAVHRLGSKAKVAVIKHGGELLPLPDGVG